MAQCIPFFLFYYYSDDDFQLIFDQEVTIEIRNTAFEPLPDAGALEILNFKLFVLVCLFLVFLFF